LPWRSTGNPAAPSGPDRTGYGIIIGFAALPALWYLIQLANPVGYSSVVHARVAYLDLFPPLVTAIVVAMLAATRWLSPVAEAIAGVPLLTIGLLLVLMPTDAARWIASLVWMSQSLAFGVGQSLSLGAFLLFGGLLVTSAALPWRWRPPRPSGVSAPVEPQPVMNNGV
jgi:hypothetical protein